MAEMIVILLRLWLCVTLLWNVSEGKRITVKNCGVRYEDPPPKDSKDDVMARIVGGATAVPGDYPWMVTVYEDNNVFDHVCGGAIINERWILTAAHCIDYPDKPWKYKIYVGLHRQSKKSHKRAKLHKISKIILHEDFDPESFENDIALIKTKYSIRIRGSNGYVNGICLPINKRDPTGWATVSGWGHTAEGGDNSDILKAVKLPLVSRRRCQEAYEDSEITESMICAGMADRDSCQNDSGGPLVQQSKRGTYTLIGIVSNGAGCGDEDYPGIYTKVAYYLDWMEENMDY